MKILGQIRKNNGCDYHRVINPLRFMEGADTFLTNDFKEEYFIGIDVYMYNKTLPLETLQQVNTFREKYGFKICVDIDDYWELDPHHILYQNYIDNDFAKEQIENIVNADFVFTTHERLLEKIFEHNKNVHVLPNAIPKAGQFNIERTKSNFTRLFWQGTATHQEDIALLQRPVNCLAPIAGKIKMILAGHEMNNREEIWGQMCSDYTAGFKHQYKIIPGVNVTDWQEKESGYYSAYAEADICLIPLLASPFNKMKSNLKVLEAANLGLPVICSQVDPYLNLPVLYAKNSSDWVNHINRLVKSKKRQAEAGEALKYYADKHFNFRKINNERKEIFEYTIKTETV